VGLETFARPIGMPFMRRTEIPIFDDFDPTRVVAVMNVTSLLSLTTLTILVWYVKSIVAIDNEPLSLKE
jgi:hypothetical protein